MFKNILILIVIGLGLLLTYSNGAKEMYNKNLGEYTGKIPLINKENNSFYNKIEVDGNKKIEGNLSDGKIIEDLKWASLSNVACFPATQNKKFNGKTIIYSLMLTKNKTIDVKLIPENINDNMSMFIYKASPGLELLPPDIDAVYDCEVDHKWDRPKVGKTQDHTRHITMKGNTIKNEIYIGVVGANGLTSGKFTLDINIK